MTVYMIGDIDLDTATKAVNKAFGKWTAKNASARSDIGSAEDDTPRVVLIDYPGAASSTVIAGRSIAPYDPDAWVAMSIMNRAFGGGFESRLNMNLREDKGWSYGYRSGISRNTSGDMTLRSSGQVQTDKTKESIEELRKEIRGISSDRPPTQDELTVVKSTDTLSLPGRWESISDVLASIGEIVQFSLPDDYWSTYAQRVNSLDVEDVTLAAKQHITPDNYVWVVVGDRAVIESGIRELGFDSVRFIDADGDFVYQ